MATGTLLTIEQFDALPERDDVRYELVHGELIEMPRRIEEGLREGFVTAQSRLLEPGCPSVFGLELDEDLAVLQYFGYKHGMEVTLALYKERVAAEYYEKQDELRRRRRRRPEGE